jgi:hypothetical protein
MGRSELDRVGVLSDRSLIPSEGYRGAYRLSVRAGNATSIRKRFPLPDETLCSGDLILKDSSAAKLRVPHISPVFCEIWDTTAFDLNILGSTRHVLVELRGIPHLEKSSEIWGTRSFVAQTALPTQSGPSCAGMQGLPPLENGRLMMKWVDRFTYGAISWLSIHARICRRISGNSSWAQSKSSILQSSALP